MKKTSFLAAFSLLTAVLLASCATTRAYVEGIDDYEKQEIGTKGNRFFLNDANTVSWGERTLKMPETTQVSTGVGLIAFSYVKSWEKSEGEFSVGGKPMFPTEMRSCVRFSGQKERRSWKSGRHGNTRKARKSRSCGAQAEVQDSSRA